MYEKFGQFIDGKWQQATKNETYDVINPATEERAIMEENGYKNGDDLSGKMFPTLYTK